MASNLNHSDQMLAPTPPWTVNPNEIDLLAWAAVAVIGLAVFIIMTLYAKFDKWAEHKSEGTPLAKTIPTMLTIALLYEVFPLDHFHFLLPLSAIMLAVMADWMRERSKNQPKLAIQEPPIQSSPKKYQTPAGNKSKSSKLASAQEKRTAKKRSQAKGKSFKTENKTDD